jgi:cell division protein ZapA (FtsZ GTPase activity inhibitor)
VHLYVGHLPIFQELTSLADLLQGHIQTVSSDTPFDDLSQTAVVTHQVPTILLMELVSQLSQRVRVLEGRIVDAEATIQHLRQHLRI